MSFTKNNHYVPIWYQELFIASAPTRMEYCYLDLKPNQKVAPNGHKYWDKNPIVKGASKCFKQEHLYTTTFGNYASDIIERKFFGKIDKMGREAVLNFSDYDWMKGHGESFNDMLVYLDAQKLRTPKGLNLINMVYADKSWEDTLYRMQQLSQMHCTIWAEGVWEVISCDYSDVKFIISDHPVTTYNKDYFPNAPKCRYPLDAPIELIGTHTILPLSLNRCLIITNLGYVRNPNLPPSRKRENPRYFAETIIDKRKVQTGRQVNRDYVTAINYVIKMRARKYIAAGKREWLYPEESMKSRMWNKLGGIHFLMPDPRQLTFTTGVLVGLKGGGAWGEDEYGRPPVETPEIQKLRDIEWKAFQSHKEEWDVIYGKASRKRVEP